MDLQTILLEKSGQLKSPLWFSRPIEICYLSLNQIPDGLIKDALPFLSLEEQKRAKRIVNHNRYRRFILGHYFARLLLSRALGIQPNEISINFTEGSKPTLINPAIKLDFNISHSHELIFVAIGKLRAIGIDIQEMRPLRSLERLIKFSHHQDEKKRLPSILQKEHFYQTWTAKEALLKGDGRGLRSPMNRISLKFDFRRDREREWQSASLDKSEFLQQDSWQIALKKFNSTYQIAIASLKD